MPQSSAQPKGLRTDDGRAISDTGHAGDVALKVASTDLELLQSIDDKLSHIIFLMEKFFE